MAPAGDYWSEWAGGHPGLDAEIEKARLLLHHCERWGLRGNADRVRRLLEALRMEMIRHPDVLAQEEPSKGRPGPL